MVQVLKVYQESGIMTSGTMEDLDGRSCWNQEQYDIH